MADYDSEDSFAGGDDVAINVLLGYASQQPTVDDFSQLGGRPTWLDGKTAPSGALAKCKVCNGIMSLLLQLYCDLPEWFPGHERRLYILGCRRKPCRRKSGSIRALRSVRVSRDHTYSPTPPETSGANDTKPSQSIGEAVFGTKLQSAAQLNPFAPASSNSSGAVNPFSPSYSSTGQTAGPRNAAGDSDLPQSFAQKLQISSRPPVPAEPTAEAALQPWTEDPTPYAISFIDAEKEYLEPEPQTVPNNARLDAEGGSLSISEEKALFESSMDKAFQQFADRLTQNPEQVLRYEFGGQPLLYSRSDAVGKLLAVSPDSKVQTAASRSTDASQSASKIPRCTSCGAARVFELQLAPHAITELERDETGIDGMEWGAIIVGVCSQDCSLKEREMGAVSYIEEWVGVQWEEIVETVRR